MTQNTHPIIGGTAPTQSAAEEEHRSSGEIKEHIDETKSRMDRTLDKLGERVDPRAWAHEVKAFFGGQGNIGDGAKKVASAVARPIRENPLAALALGASVIWFVASTVAGDESEEQDDEAYRRDWGRLDPRITPGTLIYGGGLKSVSSGGGGENGVGFAEKAKEIGGAAGSKVAAVTEAAKSKLAEAGEAAKDKVTGAANVVGDVAGSAKDAVVGAANSAKDGIVEGYHTVKSKAQKLTRGTIRQTSDLLGRASDRASAVVEIGKARYRKGIEENPLALILGAVGVGIVAGISIPVSRRENEIYGEYSDEITDRIKSTGEELAQKGKRVGEKVVGAAMDQVESAEIDSGGIGKFVEKTKSAVGRAVSQIGEKAKDAMEEEGLAPEQLKEVARSAAGGNSQSDNWAANS